MSRAVRALVALVIAFGLVPVAAQADVSTISQSGTISAIAATQPLVLSGQSTCGIALSGTATGVTIVPQATSDTPSNILNGSAAWVTATTINAGSITYAGTQVTYTGNVASQGVTGVRLNVTAYSTGTPSYTITCSPALGALSVTTTPSGTQNTAITSPLAASGAVQTTNCDPTTASRCATVTAGGALTVTIGGTALQAPFVLTAASATSCTSISSAATSTLLSITNASTAAQTSTISIFNDQTCTAANRVFQGILGASQTINFGAGFGQLLPGGAAYSLSAAATANIVVDYAK